MSLVRLSTALAFWFFPLAATAGDSIQFLVEGSLPETDREMRSCTAPAGAVARITGLAGLDTYVARAAPVSSAGHIAPGGSFGLFGNGAPLDLADDHMVTQDPAAAEICGRLDAGEASEELQRQLSDAIARDALWWPVRIQAGERVYVTANHVSVEREQPDDAPLGYLALPRYPGMRILALSGQDTTQAHVVSEPVVHAEVKYCHYGFNLSPLYQHLARGEPLDEPITNGIWRGCNDSEEAKPAGMTWETRADCPSMILKSSDTTYALSPEDLLAAGSTAASGVPERFMTLCPETAKAALRDLCESGESQACGMAAELASGCALNEATVFSCRIRGRKRIASLCMGQASATYLFGPPDAEPEMRLSVPLAEVMYQKDELEGNSARVANTSHSYEIWSSPDRADAGVRVFAASEASAEETPVAALTCDPDWQISSFYNLALDER